jgi:ELWxxDGT repeat protein
MVALASVIAIVAPLTASADRLVIPGGQTFASTGTEMVAFDGYGYLAAAYDLHGNELWRTNGTDAGTTLVKDFNVGNASSQESPRSLGARPQARQARVRASTLPSSGPTFGPPSEPIGAICPPSTNRYHTTRA